GFAVSPDPPGLVGIWPQPPAPLVPGLPFRNRPDGIRREVRAMRLYEAMYILDPGLDEDQQTALVDRFQALVGSQGGEVQHLDRWERRGLAYEVKGRREGYYVVMNFRGTPAVEAELGRVMGITDGVLRHLIGRMDERRADRAIADAKAAAE